MTVDAITQVAGATQQVAKPDQNAANEDRFLRMLIAQLKNQDPLNPLDNAQVTTQMAQISTVEGINKLNATLAAMAAAAGGQQAMQATTMVGRQVLASGNTLTLAEGGAHGGYMLDGAVDGLKLTVKSASGEVVYTAELGAQQAGLHVFSWDGVSDGGAQSAPGAYSFEITAKNGKETVGVETLTLGRVDGVTPKDGGAKLSIGSLGEVDFAAIKHIF
jgi:flagellar basal-body rod modification protein FlgD